MEDIIGPMVQVDASPDLGVGRPGLQPEPSHGGQIGEGGTEQEARRRRRGADDPGHLDMADEVHQVTVATTAADGPIAPAGRPGTERSTQSVMAE